MLLRLLVVIIFVFAIVLLLSVGSCIAIAHTLMYFIPNLTLIDVLTPSAIMSTVIVIMVGGAIKSFLGSTFPVNLDDYEMVEEVVDRATNVNIKNSKSKQR